MILALGLAAAAVLGSMAGTLLAQLFTRKALPMLAQLAALAGVALCMIGGILSDRISQRFTSRKAAR